MLECFWLGNLMLGGIAHHQAAGFFGVEADDFVLAVFFVFKYRRNHAGIKAAGINGFEIFM